MKKYIPLICSLILCSLALILSSSYYLSVHLSSSNIQTEKNIATNTLNNQINSQSLNHLSLKDNLKQCNPILGKWEFTNEIVKSYMSIMSKEEMLSYCGKLITFNDDSIEYEELILKNPKYHSFHITKNEFYSKWRFSPSNLGLKKTTIERITIETDEKSIWNEEDNHIIIKDKNTLYLIWNGVFFKLNRLY